jgi:hypothetical protein
MQLIQNGSPNTPTFPAKQPPAGSPGYANSGPPGVVQSTRLDPDVVNTVLAEIIAVLTAASISPDRTDNGQLLKALKALYGTGRLLNVQAFATAGAHTYTPTPGMKSVIIECQGGGAAGGGASSATSGNVSMGAPGTSGAYAKGIFTAATIGASQTVTVGAGGVGVLGLSGGNGGASSVGTIVTSPGGIGGSLAGAVTPPFLNANGSNTASPAGGNIFAALGATGGVSIATSTATLSSGFGGPSLFGPGPPITQVNQAGASASSFGAGGGPALMNSSSGPLIGGGGGNGIVIFWEYS